MTFRSNTFLLLAFRFIVGGVFIYASLDKIIDPASFARDINNYHVVPFGFENLIALFLPWLEFFVGVGLILGILMDGSALISMGMMGMFILAMIQAILRGYDIECGCGLKEGEMVGLRRIIEDAVYLVFSWLVYKRTDKRYELFPK